MNKLSLFVLGLSLAAACTPTAVAQDQSAAAAVTAPKYMQITVEYTKPGRGGLAHDKTESAFVQAMARWTEPQN